MGARVRVRVYLSRLKCPSASTATPVRAPPLATPAASEGAKREPPG